MCVFVCFFHNLAWNSGGGGGHRRHKRTREPSHSSGGGGEGRGSRFPSRFEDASQKYVNYYQTLVEKTLIVSCLKLN